ncbi:hypothetical protein Glove_709g81 [Diversispora epigaea]|uniref:Uncharacterized protein n=1 Tax=Diversispora epigaea TaxID=1348612 RepID=A0A397G4N4_9GLOM|nr:hypothetical protein Glove_709g81 [Diversispora epigaea]
MLENNNKVSKKGKIDNCFSIHNTTPQTNVSTVNLNSNDLNISFVVYEKFNEGDKDNECNICVGEGEKLNTIVRMPNT